MITLDQVLLLEQKVEGAVAKIQQLEAENDALRKQCAELTNALTAKSEQLSTFESDNNKIESGIRNALDRLSIIENTVLKAGQAAAAPKTIEKPVVFQQDIAPQPLRTAPAEPSVQMESFAEPSAEPVSEPREDYSAPSFDMPAFDSMENVPQSDAITEEAFPENESEPETEEPSDDLGFDIF